MQDVAGVELRLAAKLAGGASMFSTKTPSQIGLQNIETCERILRDWGIPIVGRHCGGKKGRRMLFDTSSGKVVIEIVGEVPVEL